ncbi:hypothetical protein GobsT_68650 [Gemmata obscuriglobus]|nr:hypothetical protein GobsT_68650 [Gemmata obscuriglobus]VTS11366.1 unnamed protein product [Gemmata obscuriglobus UQM 2246]
MIARRPRRSRATLSLAGKDEFCAFTSDYKVMVPFVPLARAERCSVKVISKILGLGLGWGGGPDQTVRLVAQ